MKYCVLAVRWAARIKLPLSIGTALLVFAATGSAACAEPIVFNYTGSLVDFTVPTTGDYQILAYGAQGGAGGFPTIIASGGLGAEIGGDFNLTFGEVLQIAVGGVGGSGVGDGGGGGGGSFVVGPNDTPLVIAGGGGGGATAGLTPLPGLGGLTGTDGGAFEFNNGGTGGNGGSALPGELAGGGGAGGGGFLSAGGNGFLSTGGGAFPDLAGGSNRGGFGGGGGAGPAHGGGGGGGYSGGGGSVAADSGGTPGGGGGSFDAGIDQILMADLNAGNGEVVITEVAIPEPASLAPLGFGLVGLAALCRRRRPVT
jgi:hypothetical protein